MNSVLLVEDTKVLAEQIADLLVMEGYEVIIAGNGVDALKTLQSHRPDVVITDLLMPEMDGFELIERMKERPALSEIPVIVLTAKSGEETDERLRQSGIWQVLRKPCAAEDLVTALQSLVLR